MDENKINHLNMLEQSLSQISQQKQGMQAQLLEIDSALEEVKDDDAFKLVGNILVKKKSDDIKAELGAEKEDINNRMSTLEEQEAQMQNKTDSLRKELMKKND